MSSLVQRSWGGCRARPDRWLCPAGPIHGIEGPVLPVGRGRSYGDVGLISRGVVLDSSRLRRIYGIDESRNTVLVEAGVVLSDLLTFLVDRGWWLPVVPGTLEATVGGCVANDVHGKNDAGAGSFGNWVRSLQVRVDDGRLRLVERGDPLYHATIGGLGLTGMIVEAELTVVPCPGTIAEVTRHRCEGMEMILRTLVEPTARTWNDYRVAWIDTRRSALSAGLRGVVERGTIQSRWGVDEAPAGRHSIGFTPPFNLVRPPLTTAVCEWKWRQGKIAQALVPVRRFLAPLDGVLDWPRLYGPGGFVQLQCLLPLHRIELVRDLLQTLHQRSADPFLGVLKVHGGIPRAGMMSFPAPGLSFAVDVPNRGWRTEQTLNHLHHRIVAEGGRLYPAKDHCMSPEIFRATYGPKTGFLHQIARGHVSDFARRVMPQVFA